MMSVKDFPDQGTLEEQVFFALKYAVRAPSTHNSQPWLFRFADNELSIFADWSRKMSEGDRDGRDICISLGACIEHTITSLEYFGLLGSVSVTQDFAIDTAKPCATFALRRGGEQKESLLPFMEAIEHRFNARGPFEKRPVPAETLQQVSGAKEEGVVLTMLADEDALRRFALLTGEGMRTAHRDPKFRKEISRWMINNYSKKKEGIPGYTMLAPGPLSVVLPTIIGTFNMGRLLSKLNFRSIDSSSGAIIFCSDDTPSDWLHVGMLFARVSLMFNIADVRTSVYVASIEMPEVRLKLEESFSLTKKPQFACAFGYPKVTFKQSPRYDPKERVVQ